MSQIPLSIPLPDYIDVGAMLDRAENQRRLALQEERAAEDWAMRRQDFSLKQAEAERQRRDDEAMRTAIKAPTREDTLRMMREQGDPRVFEVEKWFKEADQLGARTKQARIQAKLEEANYLAYLASKVEPFLGDPDGGMGAAMLAIQEARKLEIDGVDEIEQQIQQNPASLAGIIKSLKAAVAEPEKPQGLMNVGAGGAVFDPVTKQPVFQNPRVVTPPQPPAPTVVQTATGPQLLDRTTGRVSPLLGADGKPVGAPLAASERADARKFDKAAPALKAIEELSEKINTASGLIAKMRGEAEKIAAQANYDDDVAEYQSIISMWTPMVARALGHTGVLTEMDVQSVKDGFPKPGDSKSLRDRKIARLKSILSDIESTERDPTAPKTGTRTDPLGIR